MRLIKALILIIVVPGIANAQNLVPNGDFEEYNSPCFIGPDGINKGATLYWFAPGEGTSDWFCKCAGNKYNGVGKRSACRAPKPQSGKAYAGFFTHDFTADKRVYREYISVELKDTLEKGQLYHLSFYLALDDLSSDCYTNNIGAAFTSYKVWQDDLGPLRLKPQIENDSIILDNPGIWVFLSFTYTATGSEKFLTIGDFTPIGVLNAYELKTHHKVQYKEDYYDYSESYYFIDNIRLEKPVP